MKNSVIKDIFYGNRGYSEEVKKSQKDMENLDVICDLEDKLKNQLTPEQFKLVEKFIDAIEKNCCKEVEDYYAEGFKLGLLVGIETMENE